MKKIMLLCMGLLIIALVACGNTDENKQVESNDNQTTEDNVAEENTEATGKEGNAENMQKSDENNDQTPEENGETDGKGDRDLEEYDSIASEIDVEQYKMDIKENNSHKRIILYEDEQGQKEYKSIYFKDKNRLKIIALNQGDGQIFNKVID